MNMEVWLKAFLLIMIIFFSHSLFAFTKNLGHRAGGGRDGFFKHLPENSMEALRASLGGADGIDSLQFRQDFLYLEFDVQETKDHQIVVFHDKTLERMVLYQGENKIVLDEVIQRLQRSSAIEIKHQNLEIKDLTLEEIKMLKLANSSDQKIPTLDQFLEIAKNYGLSKPIVVEIKYFYSHIAKEKLIKKVAAFRDSYMKNAHIIEEKEFDFPETTVFLSFPKKFKLFKKIMGKEKTCELFKEYGFDGVYMAVLHFKNLC